jgi:hypothetical protein
VSTPDVSAEGAKEYSPEWSAAELRDLTPSRPNPFRGVTEMVAHQVWPRFDEGGKFCRPWSGALSFLFDEPGVPLRFTPGSSPSHPPGALFAIRYGGWGHSGCQVHGSHPPGALFGIRYT